MLLDITGGGGRGEVREDEEMEREVDEEEVWGSRRRRKRWGEQKEEEEVWGSRRSPR